MVATGEIVKTFPQERETCLTPITLIFPSYNKLTGFSIIALFVNTLNL